MYVCVSVCVYKFFFLVHVRDDNPTCWTLLPQVGKMLDGELSQEASHTAYVALHPYKGGACKPLSCLGL